MEEVYFAMLFSINVAWWTLEYNANLGWMLKAIEVLYTLLFILTLLLSLVKLDRS